VSRCLRNEEHASILQRALTLTKSGAGGGGGGGGDGGGGSSTGSSSSSGRDSRGPIGGDMGEDVFQVECLMAQRNRAGKRQFLVRWLDYAAEYDSWEDEVNTPNPDPDPDPNPGPNLDPNPDPNPEPNPDPDPDLTLTLTLIPTLILTLTLTLTSRSHAVLQMSVHSKPRFGEGATKLGKQRRIEP
jgi:hypothetical protein